MPLPFEKFFASMGPKEVYLAASNLWDFVFFVLFWFYTLQTAFATRHGLARGLTATQAGAAAVTGEAELKKNERVICFILSLMFSISLVTFSNFSLKFLFEITGVLPAIMCAMLAFGAYGFFVKKFGEQYRLASIGGAVFIAGGAWSLLFYGEAGGATWMYPLFWMAFFVAIVGGFATAAPVPSGGAAANAVQRDLSSVLSAVGNLGGEVAKIQAETREAESENSGLIEQLKNTLAIITQRLETFGKTSAFQSMLASAFALAITLWPTSSEAQIRKKLEDQFGSEVATAAIAQAKAFAPAAPPAAPPAAAPPTAPAQISLPPKQAKQTKEGISSSTVISKRARTTLMNQVQRLQGISQLLEALPKDLTKLFEKNRVIQQTLEKLQDDCKRQVKDTKKFEEEKPELVSDAVQLERDVATLKDQVKAANETFQKGVDPISSLLVRDGADVLRFSQELKAQTDKIDAAISKLEAKTVAITQKDVPITQIDLVMYKNAFAELKTIVAAIINSLETHGAPTALLAALNGFSSIVKNYPELLNQFFSRAQELGDRWEKIKKELTKLGKVKKVTEEAKQVIAADTVKIKEHLSTLFVTMTMIEEVPFDGSRTKGYFAQISQEKISEIHEGLQQGIKLLIEIDEERRKTDSMTGTKSAATNKFLELLAIFSKEPFVVRLPRLAGQFKSAVGKPEANKLLGPGIQDLKGLHPSAVIQDFNNRLIDIETQLASELARRT